MNAESHNAAQLQWMLDGVGWGGVGWGGVGWGGVGWVGWGGVGWGWMNILGVFNMLWHNFEINKPIFELANTVRFTEYLRAIFKSLPPNIYISTSASRFDDT